jgi:HEAT repeat protein
VRRFALIQLAQKDHGKAVQTLVQMYDSEKNETIKGGIIDGLGSVLEESSDKQALHKLMAIAKSDPSIELRKKAITWIGQSKDPEATQFLVDLLK